MSNKECQRDEICALESIYNEEEIQTCEENGLLGGQFYAYIDLPTGFKVVFRNLLKKGSCLKELPLEYLPPLSLHFSLPSDYPCHSPPVYKLSCQWLQNKKLMLLCKKLDAIWKENEGMEVLFLWTQFLKEDTLKFLMITDTLDVSSFETTFIKQQKIRQAVRARQLEEQEKKNSKISENRKVDAPSKQSDTPATCYNVVEYQRRKHSGRPWWGRRDRFVNRQNQKDTDVSESKTENYIPGKTETMTASTENTGTVQDNSSNSGLFVHSNNNRAGNSAQRRYYRGSYRRVHGTYYNRSVKSGDNHRVSIGSSRSVYSRSSDQIVSKDLLEDNQDHKTSAECDHLVDCQCGKNSKAVHMVNASQNCTIDNEKKEVEVTVDGVESVKASKSTDVRGKDSESAQSNVMSDRRSNAPTRPRMSVIQLLKEYNEARQRTEFSRNFYTCKICFQDKQGSHCTRFDGCGHVFCKSCVAEYFEVRIKEGRVRNIYCPEENCTSEALPGQVQELVSAELFSRYDTVLLSALLDTMEDMLYCPRPACQYPVVLEPGEKMATCPSCTYAFCIYCKMVYHGIEPCRFRSYEKRRLVEEYCSGSEERRSQMEQRYGKKQLQSLVETSLSENWLTSNSKKCPSCSAAIEKSDGCNKMACWKCSTFFCWLCEERLNPESPYLHFSNPASKCYNLLFHGVSFSDDDDEDDGWWEAHGIFLESDDDDDD